MSGAGQSFSTSNHSSRSETVLYQSGSPNLSALLARLRESLDVLRGREFRLLFAGQAVFPETPLIEENFATVGPAAGVTPARFQAILEEGTLLKRLPTLAEVADTAAFIASDRAGAMTATVVNLSAGSITD